MAPELLKNVIESAMLAAGRALSLDDFLALFEGSPEAPDRAELRTALTDLGESLEGRAVELVEVASGYRLQVRREYSPWLGGLFAERPPRYSRALLETLALIAYRQPITRGEIEDVRGVAVSSNIIKTLMEREWIRVLGHREVPGRPALFGTTREFLDHFGLKSLEGLPPLAEIRDLDQVEPDLFAPARAEDAGARGPDGLEETAGAASGDAAGGGDAPTTDEEQHDDAGEDGMEAGADVVEEPEGQSGSDDDVAEVAAGDDERETGEALDGDLVVEEPEGPADAHADVREVAAVQSDGKDPDQAGGQPAAGDEGHPPADAADGAPAEEEAPVEVGDDRADATGQVDAMEEDGSLEIGGATDQALADGTRRGE